MCWWLGTAQSGGTRMCWRLSTAQSGGTRMCWRQGRLGRERESTTGTRPRNKSQGGSSPARPSAALPPACTSCVASFSGVPHHTSTTRQQQLVRGLTVLVSDATCRPPARPSRPPQLLRELGVKCDTDTTTELTPGQKFRAWEEKGVMLRVELGPKEAEAGTAILARCRTAGGCGCGGWAGSWGGGGEGL